MDRITEYKILIGVSPADLTVQANELIEKGWQPTGGVFVSQSPVSERKGDYMVTETRSYQAMVKLLVY